MNTVLRKVLERSREAVRPYYLRYLYFPLFPDSRPTHFGDCWNYPAHTISPDLKLPEGNNRRGPDLLFFPMTDWHTRIQRTQHLARTFGAAGHRCFYLNPHLGREFPRPYAFSSTPQLNLVESLIAELHVHLPLEPVFHDRLLTPQENARIIDALKTLFDAGATKELVQIVSFPLWLEAAQSIRDQLGFPIVYDCHDVLRGFRNISPEITNKEADLFEASDLVIFSSQELLDENVAQLPQLKAKSIIVRNAVDETLLRQGEAHRKTARFAGANSVTIGYVGALDFWFDVDAVELAARSHPEWEFLLIGRVEDKRILRLDSLPNVELIGEVPHSALHKYMPTFRAALIPFERNELTIGTNPIKLYEYFSYGLPVVSTALPEMEEFGEVLYLYKDCAGFLEQLEAAVKEDNPGLRQNRIDIAHRESWSARVSQLSKAFESLF
jgi:glycosyltransferase involved in cell wall biosynthesis